MRESHSHHPDLRKEGIVMEKVVEFLKNAEVYYLATVEGDQPRVRPFGTADGTGIGDHHYIGAGYQSDFSG